MFDWTASMLAWTNCWPAPKLARAAWKLWMDEETIDLAAVTFAPAESSEAWAAWTACIAARTASSLAAWSARADYTLALAEVTAEVPFL